MRSLEVRAHRESGVLVVTMFGVMTADGFCQVQEAIRRELGVAESCAVVADFRSAVPAMSAEDWRRASAFSAPWSIRRPVVLVVLPEIEQRAREHCVRMARHGHLRLTATDFSCAVEWSSEWSRRQATPSPIAAV